MSYKWNFDTDCHLFHINGTQMATFIQYKQDINRHFMPINGTHKWSIYGDIYEFSFGTL